MKKTKMLARYCTSQLFLFPCCFGSWLVNRIYVHVFFIIYLFYFILFYCFQAKSEEALQQTRSELDSRRASGLSEHAQISSKLESETQTRTRLESEVRHVILCDVSLHATRLIQPVLVLVFENLRWHSKLVCNFVFVFVLFFFFLFFSWQISSLRSRLEKSDKELERSSVGRVEAER